MYRLLIGIFLFTGLESFSQKTVYTTAHAHSHNDYEQSSPFWEAWRQGFGSIEADIFLDKGELIVAHEREQISRRWTLDSLYLLPLQQCIRNNKGYVFADTSRRLQLMIDIKSEALPALNKLIEKLQALPLLINTRSLKIVISGSRPAPDIFSSFPEWILFDGELQKEYSKEVWDKIEMLSDNFSRYSNWKGEGPIPEKDRLILKAMVEKAHQHKKKIRFWNAPDTINSWNLFIESGVDYINTDSISGISRFLSGK